MEASVSGLKTTGTWDEIVEHGSKITQELEEHDISQSKFEEWDEWRPKSDECLSDEITEKTVEVNQMGESPGEREGYTARDDLKKAGKQVKDTPGDVIKPDETASRNFFESLIHTIRGLDTAFRKFVRNIERPVYSSVMTSVSPYYFDNELVSANLQRKQSLKPRAKKEVFVFEVKINDDDLREAIHDELVDDE